MVTVNKQSYSFKENCCKNGCTPQNSWGFNGFVILISWPRQPSAIQAFLFNFPCLFRQCVQESSRKLWVSSPVLVLFGMADLMLILQVDFFPSGCDSRWCKYNSWTSFSCGRQWKMFEVVNIKRYKTRAELRCSSTCEEDVVRNSSLLRKSFRNLCHFVLREKLL